MKPKLTKEQRQMMIQHTLSCKVGPREYCVYFVMGAQSFLVATVPTKKEAYLHQDRLAAALTRLVNSWKGDML